MKKGILYLVCVFTAACSDSGNHHLELPEPGTEENRQHTEWCIEQNEWIYEQMNHHYFWYTEMPDSGKLDFTQEPPAFFKSVVSSQDRFSWCELNSHYKGETMSMPECGFEYQPYKDKNGLSIGRILYVTSDILKKEKIKRGDWIRFLQTSTNEICIQKGRIEKGRFIGEATYRYLHPATKADPLAPTIPLDSVYLVNGRKIGYVVYDAFEANTDVIQIAVKFKNKGIDDLILDLRYNLGGYVATAEYLASEIIPKEALGKVYQKQRYNKKITRETEAELENGYKYVYFHTGYNIASRNLDLPRVVILTSENTASASESTIIGLRPYMQVVTIGTPTYGKDVGSYTIADNRYKYQLQPITFRYYNALNDSTPQTGILPTIRVEDDLNHERGEIKEALLKTALEYLTGTVAAKSGMPGDVAEESGYPVKQGPSSLWRKHRIDINSETR